jgi:hypothetical protein
VQFSHTSATFSSALLSTAVRGFPRLAGEIQCWNPSLLDMHLKRLFCITAMKAGKTLTEG